MNPNTPAASRESAISEAQIREQAYMLWLERGCPSGQELENWLMAKEHLERHALEVPSSARVLSAPFPNRHCLAEELNGLEQEASWAGHGPGR